MKGDERLVKKLDELLSDELTAIMQYVVHAEMCANWGYQRLHQTVENRARQEMHHAEKLIARIIFLEGTPTVSRLNQVHVGADVPKQLQSDLEAEVRRTACITRRFTLRTKPTMRRPATSSNRF